MEIQMNPKKAIKTRLGLQPGGPAHKFFTSECAKAMDRYVPFDRGILAGTVIKNGVPTENVTADTITYTQEYAKVVYYGVRLGKEITIHTDKHPNATTYWDKRMWTVKGDEVVKRLQKYIDSGGKDGRL